MNILNTILIGLIFSSVSWGSSFYKGPFQLKLDNLPPQREATKVYVPTNYETKEKWPLVVLLHGYTGTVDKEDTYFGLRFRVTKRGFVLVIPNGTVNHENIHFWNATDFCCDFDKSGVDDTKYLMTLTEKIKSQYHIDTTRIYIIGHSNGGFMANKLACESSNLFAGIASLAGTTFKDASQCHKVDTTSLLHIHALDDTTIKYDGDVKYPGAQETINRWVTRNSCLGLPEKGPDLNLALSIAGLDATDTRWKNCKNGTEVALWTIKPHSSKLHNPHIPLLSVKFTDLVLDFLFAHHN